MSRLKLLPPPVSNLPGFWKQLSSSRRSFLALDYDGTLAPFTTRRMEACPLSGTVEIITGIRDKTGGSLAVISGRPLSEVLELLGDLQIILVGGHGREFRFPDKTMVIKKPNSLQTEGLDLAMARCITEGLAPCLEIKYASIAVHTRGLSQKEARYIEEYVMAELYHIAWMHDLELRKFNGGVELRCLGIDKGEALRTLISFLDDNTFCVYIGDDETDEDAFRVVRGHGVGIKVGETGNNTDAQGFLQDIDAVQQFLTSWLHHAPEGSTQEISWNREG